MSADEGFGQRLPLSGLGLPLSGGLLRLGGDAAPAVGKRRVPIAPMLGEDCAVVGSLPLAGLVSGGAEGDGYEGDREDQHGESPSPTGGISAPVR